MRQKMKTGIGLLNLIFNCRRNLIILKEKIANEKMMKEETNYKLWKI